MKYEEYVKRVREWLWHYTTLDTWNIADMWFRRAMKNGVSPHDYALMIIRGAA